MYLRPGGRKWFPSPSLWWISCWKVCAKWNTSARPGIADEIPRSWSKDYRLSELSACLKTGHHNPHWFTIISRQKQASLGIPNFKTWQNMTKPCYVKFFGCMADDLSIMVYHGLSFSSIQPIKPTILWCYLVQTNDNVVADSLCLQGGREGGESAGSRVSVSVSWCLQVSNVCDGIWTYQILAISTTLHTVSLLQVINSISNKKLLYLIFSIMSILTILSRIVQR